MGKQVKAVETPLATGIDEEAEHVAFAAGSGILHGDLPVMRQYAVEASQDTLQRKKNPGFA
ncbi:hypothetical protein GCM10017621_16990 [Maricaulis virginensis]|uniref:Uncharacterized protein n=1 Tax=Maricaulis virginensis TaxID=144022 RepID=A0A9W6ING7_9PROT|nr:hypothetical protein GCM10017621_16990 [Maricaulis virginensis]